MSSCRLKA